MNVIGIYLTRDSTTSLVEVWPETVGIRKFHGCVEYGAAWKSTVTTGFLYPLNSLCRYREILDRKQCRERFGFYPRAGQAWHISKSGKRTKIDIAFSV